MSERISAETIAELERLSALAAQGNFGSFLDSPNLEYMTAARMKRFGEAERKADERASNLATARG